MTSHSCPTHRFLLMIPVNLSRVIAQISYRTIIDHFFFVIFLPIKFFDRSTPMKYYIRLVISLQYFSHPCFNSIYRIYPLLIRIPLSAWFSNTSNTLIVPPFQLARKRIKSPSSDNDKSLISSSADEINNFLVIFLAARMKKRKKPSLLWRKCSIILVNWFVNLPINQSQETRNRMHRCTNE